MRRSWTILSIFSLSILFASYSSAQTNLSFTTFLIRDDNAFKSRQAYDEWINNSIFQIGHQLSNDKSRLQGYYSADLYSYASNTDLNSYSHKLTVAAATDVDDYTFSLSAHANLRNYREQFIYYNVDRYNMEANLQYNPSLRQFYYAGFRLNRDEYTEFEDLDNVNYELYGKFQRFFQSRLSLTGNVSFGVKNYINQTVLEYYGIATLRSPFLRFREKPVKAGLLSASVNVGKSLMKSLGLSVALGGQWFIGDPITAYSQGIYYYTENDLYDDPYSYQGLFATLQLTKQFGIGFQAKAGIKFQNKDYAGTPALDDQGDLLGETRHDKRNEYFFYVTKKFLTGISFPSSVDLFLNLMYRKNPSNDPYYDFKDHIGLLGFSVNL